MADTFGGSGASDGPRGLATSGTPGDAEEAWARRLAGCLGLRLSRSRVRTPGRAGFGSYMILDADGAVVAGGEPAPYSLSFEAAFEALVDVACAEMEAARAADGGGVKARLERLSARSPSFPLLPI